MLPDLAKQALLGRARPPDPPIVFRTTRSLHDISYNLQKRANDWRDSNIPAELRKIGINKLLLEGVERRAVPRMAWPYQSRQ